MAANKEQMITNNSAAQRMMESKRRAENAALELTSWQIPIFNVIRLQDLDEIRKKPTEEQRQEIFKNVDRAVIQQLLRDHHLNPESMPDSIYGVASLLLKDIDTQTPAEQEIIKKAVIKMCRMGSEKPHNEFMCSLAVSFILGEGYIQDDPGMGNAAQAMAFLVLKVMLPQHNDFQYYFRDIYERYLLEATTLHFEIRATIIQHVDEEIALKTKNILTKFQNMANQYIQKEKLEFAKYCCLVTPKYSVSEEIGELIQKNQTLLRNITATMTNNTQLVNKSVKAMAKLNSASPSAYSSSTYSSLSSSSTSSTYLSSSSSSYSSLPSSPSSSGLGRSATAFMPSLSQFSSQASSINALATGVGSLNLNSGSSPSLSLISSSSSSSSSSLSASSSSNLLEPVSEPSFPPSQSNPDPDEDADRPKRITHFK